MGTTIDVNGPQKRIDVLEKAVRTMQRKFEMLVEQRVNDAAMIQKQAGRIKKLEALHRDDCK